ncbi:MAG: response regulator [Planctomycetota bacterium]|nr:response regulator [Planctomycetota bacterium]
MNDKVLIIDDSPILRRSMRRALIQIGLEDHNVFEAGNGQEGLDALEVQAVSLVLLDLNMPVMDGEEFLERMKDDRRFSSIDVVLVTTESNVGRLMRLSRLGISGILHKPFMPEDLRELAGHTLGKAS